MDDPGGVRALLAKLREQDDAAVRAASAPPRQEPQQARRPWAAAPKRPAFLRDTSEDAYDPWQPTLRSQPTSAPAKPKDDPRKMTFADALPKLKARMKDAGVVAQLRDVCVCLTQMRQAQHALERTLAKERTDIIGRDGENLRGPEYVIALTQRRTQPSTACALAMGGATALGRPSACPANHDGRGGCGADAAWAPAVLRDERPRGAVEAAAHDPSDRRDDRRQPIAKDVGAMGRACSCTACYEYEVDGWRPRVCAAVRCRRAAHGAWLWRHVDMSWTPCEGHANAGFCPPIIRMT